MNGWIKIHRQLLAHPRFGDPDWLSVWLYLLLNATSQPFETTFDGKVIKLKPGQLVSGRLKIAQKTGVSQSKVWRILETLKNEQQIEQQAGVKSSVFTVLNWESYQNPEQQSEQGLSNKRATTEHCTRTREEEKRRRGERKGWR